MKEFTDFINEKKEKESNQDVVYVVTDEVEGAFVGVFNRKEDAEEAKKEYEITPDMKAEITEAPRSEYVNPHIDL